MDGTIYEFEAMPRAASAPALARAPNSSVSGAGAEPLVGIIRNPRSHRNKGRPAEFADRPNVLTRTPRTRDALREELADFARRKIDYLVVDGGDGTVRDVLTCGEATFAGRWPKLIVLPKGKTNALAVALRLPNVWSLAEALDAAARGKTRQQRPLVVELPADARDRDGAPTARVHGFILGAGVFTICTQAAQQAHRLGAFNSFAVLLTILWGLFKTFVGRAENPWRAGTAMRLWAGPERRALPHSRHGAKERRFLMLASTLDRFPLGTRPFGHLHDQLMIALVDAPLWRFLALLPLLATGFHRAGLARHGIHRIGLDDELGIEIDDRFILDGEYFPAGRYVLRQGSLLRFVVP
ncbi:MAG TPA: diacylglycerol kinase family protein [Novosphingobium sp.]|nr:diacylglycerol kinase family protein [Novosphingobium sp.]